MIPKGLPADAKYNLLKLLQSFRVAQLKCRWSGSASEAPAGHPQFRPDYTCVCVCVHLSERTRFIRVEKG